MARERLTFRQRDLTAALKAAKAAGVAIARIEVSRDGRLVITPGEPAAGSTDPDTDAETLAIEEAVKNAKI